MVYVNKLSCFLSSVMDPITHLDRTDLKDLGIN